MPRIRFVEMRAKRRPARQREAQIKKWSRAKKLALISGDCRTLRVSSHFGKEIFILGIYLQSLRLL